MTPSWQRERNSAASPIVSISNPHHRRLEFDSESLGLFALVSVLRVGVYRLVAASLFLISFTVHSTEKINKYSTIYCTSTTVQ